MVPSRYWRVRLGSSFTSSGGTIHEVSGFVIHEDYDEPSRMNNDVAIVRLSNPATLSDTVAIAQIAGFNYNLPDNTVVIAAGWGSVTVS